MRLRFLPILLVGLLCSQIARAAPSIPVEVREADDSVINGNLGAVHNGVITIETTKGPTTRVTIDLADLAQVIVHAPAAPKPPRATNPRRRPRPATTPTTEPTSRPADSITWHLKLADGDRFSATITQWSDESLQIKSDAITNQSLRLPADQLLELWCGPTEAVKKAAALNVTADQDDVAFVQSGDNVVTVNGTALGIAGDDLRFQYSGNERKISLARIVGILFAPKPQPRSPAALRQLVKLESGETISGNWTGLTANAVRLRTPWGEIASIPLARIVTIDTINGRLLFLSDLTPSKVEQTPFFTRVIPFHLDTALDGGPLTLSDGTYTKGIAMHARCVLQYDIAGNFTRFRSKVGLEQPAGHMGRTIIRLLADDKPIYENPDFHGDQPPKDLDLDITGVKQLTLEADFGPSQDVGARVIWANARLIRPKTTNPS
jgi:hypothetical protein